MADVYKGLQVGLERIVAVKVLPPAYAKDLDRLKRFRRESQATAKLSHPNIITIYDSGEQDGFYFYVMEYLKAESLESLIQGSTPIELRQGLKIGKDVLKALVYTHDKSIIHRDLKPGNIRFDLRGNAIVTDFGLVKDLEETSLTQSGIAIGTPQYMSPEQLLGEPSDERSDIYQMGVMLYEMFCGELPFAGNNPYGVASVGERELIAPNSLNKELPDALSELIVRCLQRQPEKRYQSAEALLKGLTKIDRKLEARQASQRAGASRATQGFSTRSVTSSRVLSAAAPTVATEVSGFIPASAQGSYHYVLSLLAGPNYQEQEPKELAYNVSMVVVPALLTVVLLCLYATGSLFPRPNLRLLEQAQDPQSCQNVMAWKANAPCYSYIEYYTSLDSRQRTQMTADMQSEFQANLSNLESDTTYYYQYVFTYDPDDTESYMYSKELEFKTKPEIAIRNIHWERGDHYIRITWWTNIETDTKVRLGKTRDYAREQENKEQLRECEHSIKIEGLEADTHYNFVIVATDPDQAGNPKISENKTLKTLREGEDPFINEDPSPDPPLVELAKSYVDKLTRMTPDERRKLKESLRQYLVLDAEGMLTAAKKRELIAGKTNEDNFHERLRFFKVWVDKLDKEYIVHGFRKDQDSIFLALHAVNRRKSYVKLDRALNRLNEAEHRGKGI